MTMPVLFEFEALPVRVITEENGEHWFCAKDICTVLGYSNASKTVGDHCREKGITKRYTLTEKGQQELQFIDEGNLYRLIIKSRKEEAKRFESWVCDEVLPALRKTGGYQMGGRTTAASRISNHRLRLSLAKELYRTRDRELRQLIHQQLADVSNALGLPVPELDNLGRAAPKAPDVVKEFWQALAFLDGKGVDYNHAKAANLLAVNMPGLADLLIEHGYPLRFDRELYQGLEESESPRCLHKNYSVSSRLAGKTVRCWVFERPAE
ncbi:BRO-N domain-containing protein [Stutzerimonas stutzeri]|uniref:BRO-N domain-containing protein n=1 Tax=Stutzerimonas stutzeri TaxID=316 RepID=UPI002112A9F6|nr:Bro-N domain-containing protein [Stutzerimonas stutzeri]MDH1589729.1 Bro-N domain-containing protein [Stutzerimonas stutzeri]UUC83873.1 Bro-N domain-containing protein [Stutzerimonas stutzeri]